MPDVNADRSFASEINTTGFVICKGNNENGELEVSFNSAYDYNGLALGLNHSCAIRRANQTVMCLGQNSEFSSSVVGGVPFESIVSGPDFTCGLRTSKFLVVCWGPGWTDNSYPQAAELLLPKILPAPIICEVKVKGTDSGQTDRHRGRLLPLQVFIDLAFLPRKNPIPDEEEKKSIAEMVARRFSVRHNDSTFDVDYDTDDGFEVLKFQLFSLTSVPPDQQKILGGDDDQVVSEDADLASVAEKLRLVSIDEDEETKKKENSEPKVAMSDEELARLLQAEEDALMMQQFVASQNNAGFEQKIRPYIDQVLQVKRALVCTFFFWLCLSRGIFYLGFLTEWEYFMWSGQKWGHL
ncbi:uncharacterized protein LOC116029827 [Ipomoea triloba]|uniref:uncharacterized protein LOC116029827 n=1 Tax=Ipomoea triloba TaxID=35885 RepID=UPI00125DB5FE|nr:uncharacterized protein LOC116029827 [Ipomoea triloba]